MPTRADAERLRSAQTGIVRLVERDLAAFFAALNLSRPEAARNALLEFVPVLVATHGETAAAVAADWYDEVRARERVPGRYRAQMVVPDERIAAVETTRRAAGALWTEAPLATLTALGDKVGMYALRGARQTIANATIRDPQAAGWQRITRPGSCDFCVMLAGRGGVYKRATADFAAHGNCNCAAVPSWDRNAPEVPAQAYVASERTSRMSDEQREAHRDRIRAYLP